MRTCLIGGAGFIGTYLADVLLTTGREVVVLGRREECPPGLNKKVTYISCNYANQNSLCKAIDPCEEVIDLAYATVPQTSFENPVFDLQSNLLPSVTLLEEVKRHPTIKKLVIVSSGGTVYGPVKRLPIIEEDTTSPISPYGITKLTIERYALMFYRLFGLPVTIVRPSNAYGLGQKPFTGQGFIATAMGKIVQGKDVEIFGEEGTIRDYLHVKDVATGILAALVHGGEGEIYNLGSGIGRSNKEVLRQILPLAERDNFSISVTHSAPRGFDVPGNVLSYGKLLNCAGWQPKISFENGLEEMWHGIKAVVNA